VVDFKDGLAADTHISQGTFIIKYSKHHSRVWCTRYSQDSWWNPATEWQAMDRVHRLGQYRPMRCVKFVISGTIEERIVKLQEKKRAVFEATVGQDPEAMARLTEDDLKFLFG
jgi:hypothetical protein